MSGDNGTENSVVAILRAAQSDQAFQESLNYHADKIPDFLQKYDIKADDDDVLLALEVLGFIDEFKHTWSTPAASPPAEDVTEKELRLALRKGLIDGLLAVITGIDRGYARAMTMYIVTFYLGIAFLLSSIVASLVWHEDASTYLFGGLGLITVISTLVFRPTTSLQVSRSKLAQLQALFIGWLNDSYNWNRYWETIINSVLADTKRPPEFEKVNEVSRVQLANTREMMELIQRYSEPAPGLLWRRSIKASDDFSSNMGSTTMAPKSQ